MCADLHSDREGQEFPFGEVSSGTRNSRWWVSKMGQQNRVTPCQISVPSLHTSVKYSCFVDNVHFQQAAEISEALVEEQVDFEAMVIYL